MPNHLIFESSPYLQQHAGNPVNWYPWTAEALQLAQTQDKPILLSIGYAACHWCHVMAHESFEDEKTAAYMNDHFINIKVDREERPDLDSIYMQAVVAMTRSGGWPLTVFLTPQGEPFYGGTYFPPTPRYGMSSFMQLLNSVNQAWQTRRAELRKGAQEITAHLQQTASLSGQAGLLDTGLFNRATSQIQRSFDSERGGFGSAPKFPQPMTLEYLLRDYLRTRQLATLQMVERSLEKMAQGGIYDQLGGGFARYATDVKWLVPHFEKMLYDNAQLSRVYLHTWQLTGKPLYRRITEEVLDYVIREMRHPSGGFYSSQDADSEGEEGKFYVWTVAEIRDVLGAAADLFLLYYDVRPQGNWEEHTILNVPRSLVEVAQLVHRQPEEVEAALQDARHKLYEHRAKRVWPGLDDKVLTAWNGLMLASFAEAGYLLDRPDYLQCAIENAQFLYDTMRQPNGRLWRTWKVGAEPKYNAYLEDYAYLAEGLLALYQATFDERWFIWARELADMILSHFGDQEGGGFFDTSDDHEWLIQRPKDVQDNATPSGNAMAATVLLKLALYTGEAAYWERAEQAISSVYGAMAQYPTGFAQWLCAAAFLLSSPPEVAIVGDVPALDTQALLKIVLKPYRPHQVVAVKGLEQETKMPLLMNRMALGEKATAYLCRHFTCQQPTTDVQTLQTQLGVQ